MKILGIEFSSEQRSVAVGDGKRILGRSVEDSDRPNRPIHLIKDTLAKADTAIEDIECVAVGIGPGSYTGIRIGVALAQGWQIARNVKLAGVNSVECIAEQALNLGLSGVVRIIVDAQRNEFYMAEYVLGDNIVSLLTPLKIVGKDEITMNTTKETIIVGPGSSRVIENGIDIYPDAETVCKLANRKNEFIDGSELKPVYLRAVSFVKAPPPRITIS